VKLRTSNLVRVFIASIRRKPIKNFGKSSRGHSGLQKIFRALIHRAHRAVIFAIAQLSCYYYYESQLNTVILYVSLNLVTFTVNADRSKVLEDYTHVLELTYALLLRVIV